MSNLLAIPFKKTYPIEIKQAARRYISEHGGTHPDEFKDDIKIWQDLRKDGVGGVVHENRVDSALLYNAQLGSVLAKLPTNIGLSIPYAPAFKALSVPISLNNLGFERASVLFNLAALYSQLSIAEDRSTNNGIKRAATNYQQAAGTLSFLGTSVLPKLFFSPDDEEIPQDLSVDFIKGLQWLMLAQAQECSWQLAKLSQYKNSLIAKIAAGTATLYHSAATTFRDLPVEAKLALPSEWLTHAEVKEHHFAAVAEFRESMVEYEASRYGMELGRLGKAQVHAKKAYDVARRGKVAAPVLHDVQSLLETVKSSDVRAQRDNDLIYHQDVPSPSALSALQQTILASPIVPKALSNPQTVTGNQHQLFSELAGWGAREAINIYNDRKNNLIEENIVDIAQELQDQVDQELRRLNLPSALEALERPVGLPPSLLHKAEEVRLEDGPAKIEASLEDVQRLAYHDSAILEEALDILDTEASEDEAARKDVPLNRLKSHEANVELIEKATRYRSILSQASESDESVRQKWDEWEESITELTLDEDTLEASVPSTTVSSAAQSTPQAKLTRDHARALRVKLEELDTLRHDRDQLVHRTRSLADIDDIQERILKASSGLEKLSEVTPDMFEDILDEELAKFDRFKLEIEEISRKQNDLLNEIENRNKQLLDSRKEDPILKDRENALQSLDLAYFKYREITRNLEEGFKFYNDLAGILVQFKEVCKTWSLQRKQEIHAFTRSMQSLSLSDNEGVRQEDGRLDNHPPAKEAQPHDASNITRKTPVGKSGDIEEQTDSGSLGLTKKTQPPSASSARKVPVGKSSLGLPAINSTEWDFEELALPPGPNDSR